MCNITTSCADAYETAGIPPTDAFLQRVEAFESVARDSESVHDVVAVAVASAVGAAANLPEEGAVPIRVSREIDVAATVVSRSPPRNSSPNRLTGGKSIFSYPWSATCSSWSGWAFNHS